MAAASEELEFERAARLRDDLGALRRAMEKQAVVLGDGTDADVVAFAEDELEAAVQVFHVRGGRVRGQRGWVVDKVEDVTTGDLVEQFLHPGLRRQRRSRGRRRRPCRARSSCRSCPPTPTRSPSGCSRAARRPGDAAGAAARRQAGAAGDRRPQRRARPSPSTSCSRAGDLTARSAALAEIQDALGLDTAPLRIECFDVSHVQGTDVVASHGRVRGRAAAQVRVPPVRDPRRRRRAATSAAIAEVDPRGRFAADTCDRTTRIDAGDGGRRRPGRRGRSGRGPARPARHRPGDRPAAQVRLPAEPAGRRRRRRRRSRRPRTCWPSSASTDVAVCGLAKRLEEVWLPGRARPGDPAAHQRGAVPAAAGPGRGAPVRHHLPPAERSPGDDDLGAGRRARARRDPAQGRCCSSTSAREAAARGHASTRSPRCPGIGPADGRRRSPPRCTGSDAAAGSGSVGPRSPAEVASMRRESGGIEVVGGHRAVRGRPQHRGEVPGGPRLVRRGQPAAGADRDDGRPRRRTPGARSPGSPWSWTCAAGRSPPTSPR